MLFAIASIVLTLVYLFAPLSNDRFPPVGFLATKLGLTVAIAIFSLSACGIMIVALLMLPETRGRSLLSLEQTAAE